MNVIHDDITDIAMRVAARISKYGQSHVYVKPSGTVSIYQAGDARNAHCADAFRIGTYTSAALTEDIADDLRFRRQELAA